MLQNTIVNILCFFICLLPRGDQVGLAFIVYCRSGFGWLHVQCGFCFFYFLYMVSVTLFISLAYALCNSSFIMDTQSRIAS